MMMVRLASILLCLCVGLVAWLPTARAQATEIRGIEVSKAGEVTRILIESDQALAPEMFVVVEQNRFEMLLDVSRVRWTMQGEGGRGPGAGLVSGVRYGDLDALSSRIALDLAQPARILRQISLPPGETSQTWRYAIDLMPDAFEDFADRAASDVQRLETAAALRVARLDALGPRQAVAPKRPGDAFVIVLDPGHGGRDPGAVAPTGLMEKDVNLKTALALKALLEVDPRYEVRLTRERDTFIELTERVEIARDLGADLFISIHADASESARPQGASVYTLSERGLRRSRQTAARNDWPRPAELDAAANQEVADILETLVERETKSKSAEFAILLLDNLDDAGPVWRDRYFEAGFVVLFAPDVPAVLLELGFLTNAADAERLATADGRNQAALAVKAAIDAYVASEELSLAGR